MGKNLQYPDKPDRECWYNIRHIRPFLHTTDKQIWIDENGHKAMWSGSWMPTIGERVRINFNGFGEGKVLSWFMEHGYIGVEVELDKEPDWRKATPNIDHSSALVFGLEIVKAKQTNAFDGEIKTVLLTRKQLDALIVPMLDAMSELADADMMATQDYANVEQVYQILSTARNS